jgi:SAM-dependent methyltransferase
MTDPDHDHVLALVGRRWNGWAPVYDDEPDHGLRDPAVREAWRAHLRSWLPDAPADVADLGCGTGSLAVLAAADGHRVRGVDLAPAMVERARAKAAALDLDATFVVGDAGDPPIVPGSLDVVLARHVAWTLPDPHAALRRWCGLLRPGGRLVLVEGRWAVPQDTAADTGEDPDGARLPATLPWTGGVTAATLRAAVAPLVDRCEVHPLSGEDVLWGRPVDDERYALVARRPGGG